MIGMMKLLQPHTVRDGALRRDFAGLMELYEGNYIRLRKLVPDARAIRSVAISRVAGALDLHLRVTERCKYTTTLQLTYHFIHEEGVIQAPDLHVRIYHDAQVGEVMSCGRSRDSVRPEYDRRRGDYPLEERWRVNRFLYRWLGYCLHQGHCFAPAGLDAAVVATSAVVNDPLLSVST
jgi:uncharacterized protein YqiB (DUF1249 family)